MEKGTESSPAVVGRATFARRQATFGHGEFGQGGLQTAPGPGQLPRRLKLLDSDLQKLSDAVWALKRAAIALQRLLQA